MNGYLIFILFVLIGSYLLNAAVETINTRNLSTTLPEEFTGFYDADRYARSQRYLKDTTRFALATDTCFTSLTVFFILAGGFSYADSLARSITQGEILTGLVFAGMLLLASSILHIPFSAYSTFVIEERYGFNKTTIRTFILDIVKSWLVAGIIGSVVFSFVIWFFLKAGPWAWVLCWIGVTVFQLFLVCIAPVVIMPLFNKFSPMEEGELKTALVQYLQSQHFALKGLYTMDGSRRSDKSNAFFTGFGKFRRIALFDTLIQKHSIDELVAIVAHEVGHYKKKHIQKTLLLSITTSGLLFFLLSLFIHNRGLFDAFQVRQTSVYASLVFFGFLYTPIATLISIISNMISRRNEFEADRFAATTYGKTQPLIKALKKLSVDNLTNLTPHPWKVIFSYSHPPVLHRIKALQELQTDNLP